MVLSNNILFLIKKIKESKKNKEFKEEEKIEVKKKDDIEIIKVEKTLNNNQCFIETLLSDLTREIMGEEAKKASEEVRKKVEKFQEDFQNELKKSKMN